MKHQTSAARLRSRIETALWLGLLVLLGLLLLWTVIALWDWAFLVLPILAMVFSVHIVVHRVRKAKPGPVQTLPEPAADWLNTAVSRILSAADRARVQQELLEHVEELEQELEQQKDSPLEPEAAWAEALRRLGDPQALAEELAKVHTPYGRWAGSLLRCVAIAGVLLVLVTPDLNVTSSFRQKEDMSHFFELWDFDGLPNSGTYPEERTARETYRPGGNPAQKFARTNCARADVDGQTVLLRSAALWEERDRTVLYLWFQVRTWNPLARGKLNRDWFTCTDSLGNRHTAWLGTGWLLEEGIPNRYYFPVENASWSTGYGLFHAGCEITIPDLDPGAEWLRIDYGGPEEIFSFTISLDTGGAL